VYVQVSPGRLLALALALSVGAALSLGITRFAYGLLLPAMREDLAWSYTLAGAMNTANAAGYLLGALLTPWALRRWDPVLLLSRGALAATVFMALSGFFTDASVLLLQRLLAGVASASVFVTGGLLAARLGAQDPQRAGWLLGVYYGGTGLGISVSAVLVPWSLEFFGTQAHGWRYAWWLMALLCLLGSLVVRWPARQLAEGGPSGQQAARTRVALRPLAFGLAAYGMFGVGYIGYMTFVVALLRAQGNSTEAISWFYAVLGLAVMASSRVWARLLDREKGGRAMALLNGLLGMATLVPAVSDNFTVLMFSGIVFGGVFLSIVASSTALVRHNLPQNQWASGISAFTVVFAAGQIAGPTMVGWIADGEGGLSLGLLVSALALCLGAALAWCQKPLLQNVEDSA
jgi:predicted MFS family arabinose efflux permease